jgi:hypothetical protein
MMAPPTRHDAAREAADLRRAAAEAGVYLPVSYSQAVAADGLERGTELAITRLGAGVVVHTRPGSDKQLPIVLGYADSRGQWYRDGHRHVETVATEPETVAGEVAL